MRYVRPVDFGVFPADQFHSHLMATWEDGIESCMAVLTRAPPGTATGANGVVLGSHTHEVDQFYFVLAGEMTVYLGDEVHRAPPGSIVQLPAGLPHWNRNEGDVDELHLEILAPSPLTFDFAAAHKAGDLAPRPEARGAIRHIDLQTRARDGVPLVRPLANGATGSHHIDIDLVDLPPGGKSADARVSESDRLYYVIEGSLGFDIDGAYRTAGPHTLVIVPAGAPSTLDNAAAGPSRFVALGARPQVLRDWPNEVG